MNLDLSAIVSELGDEAIGKCGEPAGLDKDQSVRVARALSAHMGLGKEEAIKAAAADTGLPNEVVSAMLGKLVEKGAEMAMEKSGVGSAVQDMASGVLGDGAKGMFGKMFGRK